MTTPFPAAATAHNGDHPEEGPEKKRTLVLDDQVPPRAVQNFHDNCINLSFKRSARYLPEHPFPVFCMEFDTASFCANTIIGKTCCRLIGEHLGHHGASAGSVSAFITFPGESDLPVRLEEGRRHAGLTAYYYINKEWMRSWGGETIFCASDDTGLAVFPRAGRIVLAEGAPEHLIRSPRYECPIPRMILAIEFQPVKTNQR